MQRALALLSALLVSCWPGVTAGEDGNARFEDVARDYRAKLGDSFTLRQFHDELLAHGDPPVPLLRPLMLGSADDGKPL
jgi:uncharacterized protein (DUF885 family)